MDPAIAKKRREVETFAQSRDVRYKNIDDLRNAPSLAAYADDEIRFMVSEFTADHPEKLFLIPLRLNARWHMLEEEIERVKPFAALLIVPLFWQIAPVFYETFRKREIPVSVLQSRNLPLAVQLIKEVKTDMLVSTPEVAAELQAMLEKEGLPEQIRAWHLIVPFGQKENDIPRFRAAVFVEYHLFPGIAVARGLSSRTFVPLPDFYFEVSKTGTCIISSLEKHALPLVGYDSGVRIEQSGENIFSFV